MDRGEFFGKAFTLLIGKGVEAVANNPVMEQIEKLGGPPAHRPPGAKQVGDFEQACTGCDACMAACPEDLILIDDMDLRYPLIYPEENPCIRCDAYPCIQACPTGALSLDNGVGSWRWVT